MTCQHCNKELEWVTGYLVCTNEMCVSNHPTTTSGTSVVRLFAVVLCLILSGQLLSSQVPAMPPETPQQFVASITSFWPAAPAPKSFTFSVPSHDTVQSTTDFKTWRDRPEIAVTNRFTVTNGEPQEFFRTMPTIVLPMYQVTGDYGHVPMPNYGQVNGWLSNYNHCVGYWVAVLKKPAQYIWTNSALVIIPAQLRVFTNSPAFITLLPDEYQAEITWGWRWQDNNGNEI